MTYLTSPIRIASCMLALALAIASACGTPRDAELGIFELRPNWHEAGARAPDAPPASAAGASGSSAKLRLELIASATDTCPGECIELTAAASGGRPPYQYTWEFDAAGLSGPGPHRVCPSSSASYHVTVIDADFTSSGLEVGDGVEIALRAGCPDRSAAGGPAPQPPPTAAPPATPPTTPSPSTPTAPEPQAPAPPKPQPPAAADPKPAGPLALSLEASAATVCAGECVELTATASGGQPPYQYNWELPELSGPGPHRVCPTKSTTYAAFAMDADFAENHLEVGATTRVVVDASCKP